MKRSLELGLRWPGRLLLASGLLISVRALAQDCVPAPAGLVGWWPGDGGANEIAGTNNGTLQGSATANTSGVVGSAFSFDGTNGFVQIPDSATLRPTNLTIEAWVRFDSLNSSGSGGSPPGQQYIVFKQNTRSDHFEGYFLGKGRAAGRDFFIFGVSSASGQAPELDSASTVTTGVWYHVAGVRGTNFIQLYVNGQFDSQTNANFPQDYGTNALYFGTSGQAYWDHKLAGALDEVSLYNRALSAGEIAAIYAAGGSGKCKAPSFITQPQNQLGYWGGSAAFTAAAGANPLSYQWQKNSVPVAGATTTSLLLTNLQLTDAGAYALQATNAYGSATSSQAVLTVKVADLSIGLSATEMQIAAAALTISGVVNHTYGLQGAAELGDPPIWTGLTNLTLITPTSVWYDPSSTTLTQRYYRVVPGPITLP